MKVSEKKLRAQFEQDKKRILSKVQPASDFLSRNANFMKDFVDRIKRAKYDPEWLRKLKSDFARQLIYACDIGDIVELKKFPRKKIDNQK